MEVNKAKVKKPNNSKLIIGRIRFDHSLVDPQFVRSRVTKSHSKAATNDVRPQRRENPYKSHSANSPFRKRRKKIRSSQNRTRSAPADGTSEIFWTSSGQVKISAVRRGEIRRTRARSYLRSTSVR